MAKLEAIDEVIEGAITAGRVPGVVVRIEHGGAVYQKSYGAKAVAPEFLPMTYDTIFDSASLTKVIATAPAIMLLAERGKLRLDDKVDHWITNFKAHGKGAVTIRHLLTHTSGLRPSLSSKPSWSGLAKAIDLAKEERLTAQPGTKFRYSDINFILLGEIVQLASGQMLDEFTSKHIYQRLGMRDTGFLPPFEKRSRIAPTERVDGQILHGIVHDPTARRMNGVAGHAGLFTTAADLSRFAQMMLNGGKLNGRRIFKSETVRLMTSVHTPKGMMAKRGLGWDIDSPYSSPRGNHFKIGGYGHTGWTGGSLWVDPATQTIVILMTSRTHPDGNGNVIALRREVATLTAEALRKFSFGDASGVLNGADVLRQRIGILPKGAKVGLITNHTGHDRHRRSTLDYLQASKEVELTALFSPEHGLYGKLDAKFGDGTDAKFGLKIYSLYGKNRKPVPDQLAGLDALVFDIQDIGCRFYTYISTMGLAMEAAAEAGVKFIVLDRVNPIGGATVAGPVRLGPSQFIAYHDIPMQHGMTAGELARMINTERDLGVELQIVKIEGWKRSQLFDTTGQPWTNPSPNMRNFTQALLYPGIGLLETAMSVGRGTDTPFEVIGAPYIDDVKLANRLNALGQPGVRFIPIRFTPDYSVHKDKPCGGVNIIVTDRHKLRAVPLGIDIARVLHKLYPKSFPLAKVGRLLCHPPTLEALDQGKTLAHIEALWKTGLAKFTPRRAKYLLYE
ncbi:MAG: DUF1343 domain-containing protein [Verrucomicrobia bacterium]|nr:DUF1343 domain-containing protein [Verrucomicrobiota bacterium]MBT5312488.1 DUF1343 domain-containing protein [Verrucomicrobiota bacterium]MBT5620489.1 DUF1343 domain-containing protein [Verrucomicrobiota bacterium]MBT6103423.1 DUF1343 domain-containing protein [Verrucomicrobiota bacterium]MBT6660756.1 DUF1343 domain-containing protein [Verrucomicrobiota bacterium]